MIISTELIRTQLINEETSSSIAPLTHRIRRSKELRKSDDLRKSVEIRTPRSQLSSGGNLSQKRQNEIALANNYPLNETAGPRVLSIHKTQNAFISPNIPSQKSPKKTFAKISDIVKKKQSFVQPKKQSFVQPVVKPVSP